jgi:hypothetical protein
MSTQALAPANIARDFLDSILRDAEDEDSRPRLRMRIADDGRAVVATSIGENTLTFPPVPHFAAVVIECRGGKEAYSVFRADGYPMWLTPPPPSPYPLGNRETLTIDGGPVWGARLNWVRLR